MRKDGHILPDVLNRNLDLVICGTAAGKYSAASHAYYAHPTNKFWKILNQSGLTPIELVPQDYQKVIEFRIGLTDMAKNTFGSDSELVDDDFDAAGFEMKIKKAQPRFVGFNGKTSAKAYLNRSRVDYGLQTARIGETRLFVLPSTSARAHSHWNSGYWFELAELVKRQSGQSGA